MIYAELPEGFATDEQKLPFFLAMEEFLARQRGGDYFFMWQVAPTVIFGRNQQIEAEVNLDFCRRNGIEVYRRKSGGGCVYADRNNIMFSHVASSGRVATTFTRYTGAVAGMLRELGLDATATGRNDIMIGDRKVSGYAFYNINMPHGSRAVVHGTMLYDADLATMAQALTPSVVKLESKGVASVRTRVTTVREHCAIAMDEFKAFARSRMCSGCETLSDADIDGIRRLEQEYYTTGWLLGSRHRCRRAPVRVEGVGEIVAELTVRGPETEPRIGSLDLTGDFFLTGDLDAISNALAGCELREETIVKALAKADVGAVIHGLDAETLARLLVSSNE